MRIASRRTTLLVSIWVITVMVTSAASAYTLLSPARKWFATPLTVYVDNGGIASVISPDPDNGVTASVGAVTAWNNSPGGPVLSVTTSTAGAPVFSLGDGRSQILFSDPVGACSGSCLAATFTGYYTSNQTGTCGSLNLVGIYDADVVFNLAYNYTTAQEDGGGGCASEIYLESVVTHEVGHVIGLAHSSVSSALMAPTVSYCVNKPLNTDDTAGRNALYNCSGGGGCTASGGTCTTNGQCCSGSCKGKPGRKTCR